jgi:hypothetical protein
LVVIEDRPPVPAAGAGPENRENSPLLALAEETKNDPQEKDTDAKMADLRFSRRSDEIVGAAPLPEADAKHKLREGVLLLLLDRIGESSAAIRDGVLTSGTATLKAIPRSHATGSSFNRFQVE